MIKIISVKPIDNKQIELVFSNGNKSKIDIKPFIRGGISNELKVDKIFNSVKLDNFSGICWENGFDFSLDIILELANIDIKQVA
jgi:hypothetical protein